MCIEAKISFALYQFQTSHNFYFEKNFFFFFQKKSQFLLNSLSLYIYIYTLKSTGSQEKLLLSYLFFSNMSFWRFVSSSGIQKLLPEDDIKCQKHVLEENK